MKRLKNYWSIFVWKTRKSALSVATQQRNQIQCPFIEVWSLRVDEWMNESSTKLQSLRHSASIQSDRRAACACNRLIRVLGTSRATEAKCQFRFAAATGARESMSGGGVFQIDRSIKETLNYLCGGTVEHRYDQAQSSPLESSKGWMTPTTHTYADDGLFRLLKCILIVCISHFDPECNSLRRARRTPWSERMALW